MKFLTFFTTVKAIVIACFFLVLSVRSQPVDAEGFDFGSNSDSNFSMAVKFLEEGQHLSMAAAPNANCYRVSGESIFDVIKKCAEKCSPANTDLDCKQPRKEYNCTCCCK